MDKSRPLRTLRSDTMRAAATETTMTHADAIPRDSHAAPAVGANPSAAAGRDLRLDLFRGLAMFIILIAHIPYNKVAGYIPARYGWSDAAEIFVFCSGMASALAFGKVFVRRGWLMGTARVAYRVWQVYWAHVALFVAIAATMAALDLSGIFDRYGSFDKSYVATLNLTGFFENTQAGLVGLLTLTYVPNYFDILPMYLVILAMIPAVMALARVDPRLAMGACLALWAGTQTGMLALPAEPWSDRPWFFNPFGWQLIFFTGFAFGRGWLPAPPVSRTLIAVAVAFLIVSIPFGRWQIWTEVDWIRDWRDANRVLFNKTNAGILRYLHFLCMAYLAVILAGPGGVRLRPRGTGILADIARGGPLYGLGLRHRAFGEEDMAQRPALVAGPQVHMQGAFLLRPDVERLRRRPFQCAQVLHRRLLALGLFLQRGAHRLEEAVCHLRHRAQAGLLGPGGQVGGQRRGLGQMVRAHAVEPAQVEKFPRRNHPPPAGQIDACLDADQPWQPLRAAGARDQPDIHLGQAKARAGGGHPPGTGHRHLEAAAQHRSVQCGDEGHPRVLDHGHDVGQVRLCRRLVELRDVAAGDEGLARAGENRHPRTRRRDLGHRTLQPGADRCRRGIDRRVVHLHMRDVTVDPHCNRALFGHSPPACPVRSLAPGIGPRRSPRSDY